MLEGHKQEGIHQNQSTSELQQRKMIKYLVIDKVRHISQER